MAKQGPLSGQQVANKYRLGELLGSGGMGAVYKAQDTRLNRPVAVKMMSPAGRVSAADLQLFTQLFQAEALRLASLNHPGHPGIPDIYDYFEEAANWFLVMKFIEGETLQDYLQRRGGRLPVDEVLKIGLQLADVLQYLHLRQPPMIFRDMKPANVMIVPDGRVSLIDFGITRLFTPGKSQDTFVALSRGYAAPEQHGTAQTTVRSDIYSLGATLHHLLSGTHPATSPFLFAPLSIQQPAQLASLIAQMVAFDPANRPTSMAEVKVALQRVIDQTAPAMTENVSSPPAASAHFPTQIALSTIPITTTLLTYEHLGGRVVDADWSPDGTRVVSGGEDRTVHIWDSATGQTLLTFRDIVQVVSWSPDGRLLALVSYDSSQNRWVVKIRGASSGTLLHQYEGHTNGVQSVAWSPDGRLLASASYKSVQVWEAATGTLVHHYEGHTKRVHAVAWSPDGRLLASASDDDNCVQVWEATSGKLLQLYEGHTSEVRAIAWSPDGKQLASASGGPFTKKSIQVWEATTGTLVRRHEDNGDVDAMAWSPNGQLLALATSRSSYSNKSVELWEIASGKRLREYRGQSSYMPIVAWSSDGRLLAALDGRPQVWSPEVASDATLPQPRRNPFGGTFADQSHLRRGRLLYRYEGHNDSIAAVAWSPNGRLLASAAYQTGVQVREAGSGKLLEHYEGHTDAVTAIAWSPDGRQLASASSDKSVQVWEVASGKLVHRYQGHTNGVQSVTWSPDGRLLASASDDDKSVQVWEAISGTLVHRYEGHTDKVKAVAWSLKGRQLLASASSDKSVQVWEPASGKLVYRYEGHSGSVGSVDAVAWSPDGGLLASTSYINGPCVQVWEAFTGKVLLTYRDHSAGVGAVAVAWSPGGKRIASWAGYEVRIWVVPH